MSRLSFPSGAEVPKCGKSAPTVRTGIKLSHLPSLNQGPASYRRRLGRWETPAKRQGLNADRTSPTHPTFVAQRYARETPVPNSPPPLGAGVTSWCDCAALPPTRTGSDS